ncbi:MAG: Holliday junction branch migration protein RuvA [Deltaproteobacteria bacterium]|nr:Holliday junction branch migration protein RuvA [Deltaproteobacteria bacterium]
MIGFLEGTVLGREDDSLLLLTGSGVGYRVHVPRGVLPAEGSGDAALRLYVSTVVRDNEIALYGFAEDSGRRLFELLLKATGIGPRLALNFLSSLTPPQLHTAILNNDVTLLCTIPGVGKKTATRLCVELGDRLSGLAATEGGDQGGAAELISALTNLGFPEKVVVPVVRQLSGGGQSFEERLKRALSMLSKI